MLLDQPPEPDNAGWAKHHHRVLQVLHEVEQLIIAWMADLGYEVEFK